MLKSVSTLDGEEDLRDNINFTYEMNNTNMTEQLHNTYITTENLPVLECPTMRLVGTPRQETSVAGL